MAITKISTASIEDDAITSAKIPTDAVGSSEIDAAAVGSSELNNNSVSTAKIADDAVTADKLASDAVVTASIADDAVTADKLANSINTDIAANTAKTTNATHTGEVTGATALTIADDVVDEANLKVSNSPTNGYFLSAQSGNTGGLTWAQVSTPDSDKIEEGNTKVETIDTGSDGHITFNTEGTERARFLTAGQLRLSHGLSGLSGGGVVLMAARSSSGTANQSEYKCDFVVPMGNLGNKYLDVQNEFTSGQTGDEWGDGLGGSGMLIATVQNNYYWGFRTKFYHITTYGDSSQHVTRLDQMYNYHTAGHGSNSAAISLAVQSHNTKTPTLRCTFSGDYWNSNVATVTFIGSPVSSYGNVRTQLSTFDSALTGQDPTWK